MERTDFDKNFEAIFENEMEKMKSKIKKPNLLLIGGTGVGKSSLINRIFGEEVAAVGAGDPVTKGLVKIDCDNPPIVFFDAEGYEILKDDSLNGTNFDTKIKPEIERRCKSANMHDHIHLVWYCISITNNRVTEYDIQNIKYFLAQKMNVAIVFTKCDNDTKDFRTSNTFQSLIQDKVGAELAFFKTCNDKRFNFDIETLVEWSAKALSDEQLRRSFITAQLASIDLKKKEAYKLVGAESLGAAAAGGFNPFPISDAVILTPLQIAMCVQIANIFWMGTGSFLDFGQLLKTQLVSMAGKAAVLSLTKIIPGFGQVINAAVAGSLTFGLGAAVTEGNYAALKQFLKTGKKPDWTMIFTSGSFTTAVSNAVSNWKAKNGK
ncbi:MAG: 50S ribosome-binding GTPase [Treponema phagedenis]|uniref:GTPase n=1 Tax=Treponema phagedenis TaxID=162 RepID=UPI0004633421|nr:GTPase [Treponema phagedenis]